MADTLLMPTFRAARLSRRHVASSSLTGMGRVFIVTIVYQVYTIGQTKKLHEIKRLYTIGLWRQNPYP